MKLGPYEVNSIVRGHVLDVLPQIPTGTVHMTVTSPPYWGLRDYGLEPQVWGGQDGCRHVWGDELVLDKQHQWKPGHGGLQDHQVREGVHQRHNGQFCALCGAWLGSLGLEPTPELYVSHLVEILREVRRVLRDDGTLWLNLASSYAANRGSGAKSVGKLQSHNVGSLLGRLTVPNGFKAKDLVPIPWLVALALQRDGWWLRNDIIWSKTNPMPESVTDRCTVSHEYIFLLTKSGSSTYWTHRDLPGVRSQPEPDYRWIHKERGQEIDTEPPDADNWRRVNLWRGHDYFYDADAIREPHKRDWSDEKWLVGMTNWKDRSGRHDSDHVPVMNPAGRNRRTVWTVSTHPYKDAHFATFPPKLIEPCILAGTSAKGACPECGAPWERVVERQFVPQQDVSLERGIKGAAGQKPMDASNSWDGWPRGSTHRQTVAWCPTCTCGHDEAVPCVVLDPFDGANTTGLVALRNGRNYLGIELNPDYVKMGERRVEKVQPRLL